MLLAFVEYLSCAELWFHGMSASFQSRTPSPQVADAGVECVRFPAMSLMMLSFVFLDVFSRDSTCLDLVGFDLLPRLAGFVCFDCLVLLTLDSYKGKKLGRTSNCFKVRKETKVQAPFGVRIAKLAVDTTSDCWVVYPQKAPKTWPSKEWAWQLADAAASNPFPFGFLQSPDFLDTIPDRALG